MLTVEEIDKSFCVDFVHAYHYSKVMPVHTKHYLGIYTDDAYNSEYSNLNLHDNFQGFSLIDGDYSSLTNILANNNENKGIVIDGSREVSITDIVANNNGGEGLWVIKSQESVFKNITANYNKNVGMEIRSSTFTMSDSEFCNNEGGYRGGDFYCDENPEEFLGITCSEVSFPPQSEYVEGAGLECSKLTCNNPCP